MTRLDKNYKYLPVQFRTLLILVSFACTFVLFTPQTHAQIVATSRVELTEPQDTILLAPYIYVTQDPEDKHDTWSISNLHKKNQRGERYEDVSLLSLGIQGISHWMVFSVTNHTDQEEWILDFGNVYDGRSGFLRKLFVKNNDTEEVFISLGGEEGDAILASNMGHASARIHLPRKETSLVVFSVLMSSGITNTIQPVLKSANPYDTSFDKTALLSSLTILAFMVMAGFFFAIGLIRNNSNYLVFSLFYLLSVGYFTVLDYSFFTGIFVNAHFANLLFFASLVSACFATRGFLKLGDHDEWDNKICITVLIVLCFAFIVKTFASHFGQIIDVFLYALPICLSFFALAYVCYNQSQYGKYGAIFLGLAWIFPAIGLFISSLSSNGLFVLHPVLMNAYWISLFGHAGFFIAATVQKIQMLDKEERQSYIQKSKKAMQKAKAIQERETADQAKLLRVIERERELMAGLRELEIHRAEEMKRAKEDADEANRAKSAFLAVVSHEVRTPMTGILGMVRLLLESKLNSEQNEFVLALQKSGETMMALLNDILDFEKIESGSMELEYLDFNLPQLARDVVTLMSGHAAGKNIILQTNIDDNCPVYIQGDPTRLRQVFLNLVNNAIKFTEEGSVTIVLHAQKVDRHKSGIRGDYEIYCGVHDTGIGISEEAQKALFDPFSQADSSISRKYGGTGLGLTICKKLIEAMGSMIHVDSETGKGSKFYFTLLAEEGNAEQADTLQSAQTSQKSLPTKRILAVEDNEMNRKVLRGFLENMGQITTMAEDGKKAIELCQNNSYDIILMDIQLPDMTGVEVTQELRKLTKYNTDRTPIIALTGNVMLEDIKSYYEASMNGFIAKPINLDTLQQTISNIHHGKLDNPFPHDTADQQNSFDIQPLEEGFEIDLNDIDDDSFAMALKSSEDTKTSQGHIEETITTDVKEDAPVDTQDGEDYLDFIMLDSLLNNLGQAQCAELMDGFLEKAEELVKSLENLKDSGDIKAIQARAHELKGMAANFGLKKLGEQSGIIEKSAKSEKIDDALEGIDQLEDCKQKSKDALNIWISSH